MATRTAVRKRVRTRRPRWVRVIKIALATTLLLGLVATVGFGWMFAVKLRKAEEMMPRLPSILDELGSRPTVVLSADGKRMFQVSVKNRQPVLINHVPKVVIDATLAAEDKRFYSHSGIDYVSLGRSLVSNLTSGTSQGGSTITMQIVKRVFTSPAKTYDRKIQDMALAVVMERKMSKNQILQLYLNEVFYGESAYGVQAAAEVYFNKKLDQLSIAEAALLARCVRRPSEENPFRNPSRALANRDTVLAIMREEGMISSKEYEEAKGERLVLARRRNSDTAIRYRAPYAVSHVLDVIRKDLPEIDLTSGGYVIETTINSELQKVAEKAVADVVRRNRGNKVTTGAMILTDREGRILAEVGGRDFQRNQYNVVTQGHRQPGSAFKPFVYSAALANGAISPGDSISNARFSYTDPTTGVTWSPRNSNGRYSGNVSIKSAIAYSYNMPVVRVMEKAGAANVVAMGESIFGFAPNELFPYLSTALGASEVRPIEMAQGYSVFQLKGDRATPFIVTRIKDPAGNVIKEYTPNIQSGLLRRDVAEFIDECLRAVATYGTGSRASSAGIRNARGKTGTTSDNKDAWFCGYTDEFLGIAWIANEVIREGKPARYLEMGSSVFGGKVTIDIWIEVMKRAQQMVQEGKFEKYDPSMDGMYQRPDASENQQPAPVLDDPQIDEPAQEEILPTPDENVVDSPPIGGVPVGGGQEVPAPPDRPPTASSGPPPETNEPEPVYALVEVCADTGRRANMYCPETVMRQFLKSEIPKRNCRIHR
ncbi:MAG: transglycosylase domain-containing protein [Fimbriimonadaceae bacterium]